MANLLEPIKKY